MCLFFMQVTYKRDVTEGGCIQNRDLGPETLLFHSATSSDCGFQDW